MPYPRGCLTRDLLQHLPLCQELPASHSVYVHCWERADYMGRRAVSPSQAGAGTLFILPDGLIACYARETGTPRGHASVCHPSYYWEDGNCLPMLPSPLCLLKF